MGKPKNLTLTCILIFCLAELFFIFNIGSPLKLNFDEFHYIPAAKQFLEHSEMRNWEHPPLAKLLIAPGLALFGDTPIGWRLMSTLFGSLTLVGMMLLGLALFANTGLALWIVLITAVNQLLYVQARIAMLDTFMMAFLTWAMATFAMAWHPNLPRLKTRRLFIATGLAVGFASACKWFGIICWLSFLGTFAAVKIYHHYYPSNSAHGSRKRSHAKAHSTPLWLEPKLFSGISLIEGALWLGVLPLIVYFVTFIPLFYIKTPIGQLHNLLDLLRMQKEMWAGQLRVVTKHPYMSQWYEWPLLTRPMWYAFDREGANNEWVRGVILLGNPLVMWSGILAVFACALSWWKNRSRETFLIIYFFAMLLGSWIFIPRKVAFYYYYYPAGMTLSLALAYIFEAGEVGPYFKVKWARWTFLGASTLLFIYFFPILSGWKIPSNAYIHWMWFRSWI